MPILEFHQTPDYIPPAETEFWIAVPGGPLDEQSGAYLLGRTRASIDELDDLIADIRANLDNVSQEARRTLGG